MKTKRKFLKLFLYFSTTFFLTACGSLSDLFSPNVNVLQSNGLFMLNDKFEKTNFPILSYLENTPEFKNSLYKLPKYNSTNEYVFEYLASRVISLKIQTKSFITGQVRAITGTGTILSKVNDDPNDYNYYVGTNLHVAQNLLTNNEYEVGFNINPFINLAFPSQNELLDQNRIKFNVLGTYLIFPNASTQSLVWTATNIAVQNYQVIDLNSDYKNNLSNPYTNNPPEAKLNFFINSFNQKVPFGADFAVLKLDFSNLFKTNFSTIFPPNQEVLWQKYLMLFKKNVVDSAVEFSSKRSTNGYIIGFPGAVNDQNNPEIGLVNLKINDLPVNDQSEYWSKPYVLNKPYIKNDVLFFNKLNYITSVSANYNIPQLNLQPGSSGSLFIQTDDKTKKVYLNGIYWGVSTTTQAQGYNGNVSVPQAFGQITQFIANGYYNLIGGKTQKLIASSTPKENAFCSYLIEQNIKSKKTFLPQFC